MTDYTICPACHKENSVEEKYCLNCGQKLIEEKEFYKMIDGFNKESFDYLSVIQKYDETRTAKRLVAKEKKKTNFKKNDKQKSDAK